MNVSTTRVLVDQHYNTDHLPFDERPPLVQTVAFDVERLQAMTDMRRRAELNQLATTSPQRLANITARLLQLRES